MSTRATRGEEGTFFFRTVAAAVQNDLVSSMLAAAAGGEKRGHYKQTKDRYVRLIQVDGLGARGVCHARRCLELSGGRGETKGKGEGGFWVLGW